MFSEFTLSDWNTLAATLALVCWAGALSVLGVYAIRLAAQADNKSKYDFINRHEISSIWLSAVFIIMGGCFFGNAAIMDATPLWVILRSLMTMALGLVVGAVTRHLVKFYYPFYMENRLRKLRYAPRISPDGTTMRLLSEREEDAYMEEYMLAEENVFSVDYDVWKDEISGFIRIEKYAGHLHAQKCPECGCQTMKLSQEEIIKPPQGLEDGILEKHYLCAYCQHTMRKTVRLKSAEKINPLIPAG